MQLLIIIFLSLLFPIGVGYTLMRFKKRKNAGRTVLTVAAPAGDAVNIRKSCTVTTAKQWCRVRATFQLSGTPNPDAVQTSHRYRLTVAAQDERLITEERSLQEFFGFCWHYHSDASQGEVCSCDPVLLEFVPPAPGTYTIEFSLKAREAATRVEHFALTLSEGVWPFKAPPYIHSCINLRSRKQAAAAAGAAEPESD